MPRVRWDDPSVDSFLARGEPVVLTGCPLVAHLVDRWSFAYLSEHFGDYDQLGVHFAPRDHTVHSRHYGPGLGKGGCTTMTFARFAALCEEHIAPAPGRPPPNLRYYLQVPVVWNDAKHDGPHGAPVETDARPLASAPVTVSYPIEDIGI